VCTDTTRTRLGASQAVSAGVQQVLNSCLLFCAPAVNLPGTYYTINGLAGIVGAVTCPVDTYGPGLRKQRACVPCPPNYVTNGKTGQTSPMQCSKYNRAASGASSAWAQAQLIMLCCIWLLPRPCWCSLYADAVRL
jgi:hypothetical protein